MELERTVEESGVYMVQAYLKRGDFLVSRKSAPVSCHTQAGAGGLRPLFERGQRGGYLRPLPPSAPPPPSAAPPGSPAPRGAGGTEGASHRPRGGRERRPHHIYSHRPPPALSDGSSLLLSGSVVIDNKLYVGMEELPGS